MIDVKFVKPIRGKNLYKTAFYQVKLGNTISLEDEEAYRVVYDFPGCFEMIEEVKVEKEPPAPMDIKPDEINTMPSLKDILRKPTPKSGKKK